MIFKYSPLTGFSIDDVSFIFLEQRELVRKKLSENYKESNRVIEIGEDVDPIIRRRDIYRNINFSKNFFFLNYDRNDFLRDVEIHSCDKIQIFDVIFNFDDELDSIALLLSKHSEISILSEGEVFFKDLKVVISDKRKMGGEGDTIGYFYCSSDVSHLGSDSK